MKAKRLILPKDSSVRPTTDKLRSAVFSILGDRVAEAAVLDGFAGSGALGIEAVSRGASFVFFTDTDTDGVRRNAAMLPEGSFGIKKGNFLSGGFKGGPFDIVFIDPPYGLIGSEKILSVISDEGALAEGGVIVYEEFYKTRFEGFSRFYTVDERRYGDTVIRFLEQKP